MTRKCVMQFCNVILQQNGKLRLNVVFALYIITDHIIISIKSFIDIYACIQFYVKTSKLFMIYNNTNSVKCSSDICRYLLCVYAD